MHHAVSRIQDTRERIYIPASGLEILNLGEDLDGKRDEAEPTYLIRFSVPCDCAINKE